MYYADLKRGEEQAEADRLLGQLVRKMPNFSLLEHFENGKWVFYASDTELQAFPDGFDTPEQALKAALEGEGVER